MPVAQREIDELAGHIVRLFKPVRVILFGSYAYGQPTEDSDVDLFIEMPFSGRGSDKALEIFDKLHPRLPVDLVVRTPEDVRRRLAWNDSFVREITQRGKILYESSDQ